jgi:S-disulfanyl-L-cysteine oxidoreductase SoxD
MKITRSSLVIVLVAAVGIMGAALGAQDQKSVWDGVYTTEQATRGEAAYGTACVTCHGGELEGDGFAPALAGPEFMSNWNGTTVGDLFERIRVSMPPDMPETVNSQDKVDIVAFVLTRNNFPAGKTELAKEAAALKQIKFEATKPGGNEDWLIGRLRD